MHGILQELLGQRFGRAVVTKRAGSNAHNRATWECLCDCGSVFITAGRNLTTGKTRSCGCYKRDLNAIQNITHNMSTSPEYRAWTSMKSRCTKPNHTSYPYYGGLGIRFCDRWERFDDFYSDMGPKPTKKHTLGRLDNAKDYSPDNCRWETMKEQAQNRRPAGTVVRQLRRSIP